MKYVCPKQYGPVMIVLTALFLSAMPAQADYHAAWVAENAEPEAETDLWSVMRDGFDLETCDGHAVAEQWARWYSDKPEYLDRIWKRADPLLYLIVEHLTARDMPTEIALLPIVESAFQPYAYSHGRAAGLWQFVPGTGRDYGLKQNWWYDGRRDIVAATGAAAAYLSDLHQALDQDWLLALAAYNSGQGRVTREIRRNTASGKGIAFWDLKLPRETSSYVPKLLGLACVINDPAEYDVELPEMVYEPKVQIVPTGGQVDLALAAELADLTLEALYQLNPAFNRWATDPDGPHELLLPLEHAEKLRNALANTPIEDRLRWDRYRIQSGQTLSHIARKFDVTVQILQQANNLNKGTRIRAGDYLMVPRASGRADDYVLSETQRLAKLRAAGGAHAQHVVRPGESLWTLSRRFDVGVKQLARWNGMAPGDTLSVGRKLVIRTAAGSTPNNGVHRNIQYRVRSGDSLWRVANRFRVSVADLMQWNGLRRDAVLQPGQTLKLVVDVTEQS